MKFRYFLGISLLISLLIVSIGFHFYNEEINKKCAGITQENYRELEKEGRKIDALCDPF